MVAFHEVHIRVEGCLLMLLLLLLLMLSNVCYTTTTTTLQKFHDLKHTANSVLTDLVLFVADAKMFLGLNFMD
jgi:hypothetical protein